MKSLNQLAFSFKELIAYIPNRWYWTRSYCRQNVEPLKQKINQLEDQLKKIHGVEVFPTRFEDLCPFPDARLPDKFKMQDLSKNDGTRDSIVHLKAYCGAIYQLGADERLLMRLFQRSLKGIALQWYTS